jgi:hypothetical protein
MSKGLGFIYQALCSLGFSDPLPSIKNLLTVLFVIPKDKKREQTFQTERLYSPGRKKMGISRTGALACSGGACTLAGAGWQGCENCYR